MRAINCKTEYMTNPIGIDTESELLLWNCEGGEFQTAYRIEALCNEEAFFDTGKVISDKMCYLTEKKLKSRNVVSWRICLWDENDECGEWSGYNTFEMGLLQPEDWQGAAWISHETGITPEDSENFDDEINRLAKKAFEEKKKEESEKYLPHLPAGYLRKSFEISGVKENTRLYISAKGLYEAYINGVKVGKEVLTPGSSNYNFEIKYQTYDVTKLLKSGENDIEIIIGDGWYRSTSGVDGDRNLYGDTISVIARLEAEGESVLVTDASWEACTSGPTMQNDMEQGEVYDAGREDYREKSELWYPAHVLGTDYNLLKAGNMVPVTENETFTGKLITTPNGERVIDFGQNLAGYVEFTLTGEAGKTVTLLHGETLDENGNFTQENFEDRARHKEGGVYQMVHYTCKSGENHYKPKFTVMGFRYVKVITELKLEGASFTANAVYSKMDKTADFTCENALVNSLVKNALWSQKGNFLDIPTDCPTRERAGWTGDAGLYADTGLMLMDSVTVFRHWLKQCRYGQYEDGRIANIAPPNNRPGMISKMLSGSVGWGDACIIVPYEICKKTGDERILRENYEMMKKWYAFLENTAKAQADREFKADEKYRDYTFETGINYGEWCEPGTTPEQSMRNGNYDVATAYFSHSGKLLSEIAEALGFEDDAAHYKEMSENAKKAFVGSFTENGDIHSERQCQYIRPIKFGLLPEEKEKTAADRLRQLVENSGYHLNTGFLTTPDICGILAEHGFADDAYRLLLQEDMPGWLYSVKKGATTIWETWDGINKDGVPKDSLNHYSYGAVVGWLINGICGIKYANSETVIKPFPNRVIGYATAGYDSPKGTIKSGWHYEGEKCVISVEIPCNMKAKVILPDGSEHSAGPGKRVFNVLPSSCNP